MLIENNVPMPPRGKTSKYAQLLTLEPNQTAIIDKEEYQAAYQHCKNHGVKIISRSINANQLRIQKL